MSVFMTTAPYTPLRGTEATVAPSAEALSVTFRIMGFSPDVGAASPHTRPWSSVFHGKADRGNPADHCHIRWDHCRRAALQSFFTKLISHEKVKWWES